MMAEQDQADFWVASGHHLVDRTQAGGLAVTDALIRAYLARPELVPPPEACPVERGLHATLMAEPRQGVSAEEIALVADADARENLSLFLAFRDHLIAHATLEAAWLALVRQGMRGTPPLFVQQLTHLVARNAFDGEGDAFVLRAGECFFRPQRMSVHEGAVLLADEEAIAGHEHARVHSPLMAMLGGPAVSALEILTEANAASYAGRSDAHDLVFNLSDATHGRAALARALTIWIRHLAGIALEFTPVEAFHDARFGWFLALDEQATAIGNAVWRGDELADEARERILALFTFTLPEDPRILADKRGAKGFAILAADGERLVRIKPQNLVAGLPLAPDQG